MAEPTPPLPNQPRKKGSSIGCLLPLAIFGIVILQNYGPEWSSGLLIAVIVIAVVYGASNSARKRQQQVRQQMQPPRPVQGQRPAQGAGQGRGQGVGRPGPPMASTQYPPPAQPMQRPQQAPPQPPQVQRPRPQPAPQPRPQQPRKQAQPARQQPKQQQGPAPAAVPGTEHLAQRLIGRITELKLKGQTVEAIETLREATGMELYEASQIVRRLGKPAEAAAVDLGSSDDTSFGSAYISRLDLSFDDDFDDRVEREDKEWEKHWKKWDEE